MHPNLDKGISAAGRAGENLGIDQRAGAPQFHIVKDLVLEKFESAVDVFDPHPEKEADQAGPAPGVSDLRQSRRISPGLMLEPAENRS